MVLMLQVILPPIKKIMEIDVPASGGTDDTRVASYNLWVCLYWLFFSCYFAGLCSDAKINTLIL